MDAQRRARIEAADAALLDLSKGVNVLGRLAWRTSVEQEFLQGWSAGQPRVPVVEYAPSNDDERRRRLIALAEGLDPSHPLEEVLAANARSYADACVLLATAGTHAATAISQRIYGCPRDVLSGSNATGLDAARHFMSAADAHYRSHLAEAHDYCLSAETLRSELEVAAKQTLRDHCVEVVVDPRLVSKAAAGATRVRLRAGTCFTEYDLEQLLQHEVLVHSLTAINGGEQPLLRSLGRGAPRTTKTQEGLATFAELVTGAIDIARLERLAMRVEATEHALAGADFVEVFRYFIDEGQPAFESFNSTMRIFRGVPTTGGAAFTKDAAYLHGLLEVHTFFRWALAHDRLDLARHLFAGRMTLGDVLRLAPFFDEGHLDEPLYLPPWMTRTNGLAAYLAFSVFSNRVFADDLRPQFGIDQDDASTGGSADNRPA